MVTGAGVGVGVALLARPLSLLSRRSLYLNSGASPSFPGGISSYRKKQNNSVGRRFFSAEALTNGETAPDLRRLAETARISLTQQEVEELGPKIQQVIGWFGQLQGVDLNRVEPGIRAATAAGMLSLRVFRATKNLISEFLRSCTRNDANISKKSAPSPCLSRYIFVSSFVDQKKYHLW
ncbi:Glutamyl-tRNA(Gln) amidotransferase subunit C, chloroplastic/mitochondrial [Linum grandiflorum]